MDETTYRPCYPLFYDIRAKRVVVVGGGPVAERKVTHLLPYGPELLLVAPDATSPLREMVAKRALSWHARVFEPSDLDGAVLAFCAVGDDTTDILVAEAARERGIPLNVADVPERCDFIVGSVLRRGPFQIAVSSSGAAPAVCAGVRRDLETHYGDSWEAYIMLLGEVRTKVRERYPDDVSRRRALLRYLAGAGLLDRIEDGDIPDAEAVLDEADASLPAG